MEKYTKQLGHYATVKPRTVYGLTDHISLNLTFPRTTRYHTLRTFHNRYVRIISRWAIIATTCVESLIFHLEFLLILTNLQGLYRCFFFFLSSRPIFKGFYGILTHFHGFHTPISNQTPTVQTSVHFTHQRISTNFLFQDNSCRHQQPSGYK